VRKVQRALMGALLLCIMGVVAAPTASAIDPKYTKFAGCPDVSSVFFCIRSDTTGGHIKVGNTDTPISKTVTLSGGLATSAAGPPVNDILFNSQGGILSDPLEVPGGLTGLTGLSEFILNLITFGANKVYAKAVPVGTMQLNAATFVQKLPIKVVLTNPFLKSGCAIGSPSEPITLNLTFGTTAPPAPAKPITGRFPTGMPDPGDPNVAGGLDGKLVDNAFSAPKANGCDLIGLGLINALVNLRVGLPSAAGNNEAVFDHTDLRLIDRSLVYP
jgi:hypothetical protein